MPSSGWQSKLECSSCEETSPAVPLHTRLRGTLSTGFSTTKPQVKGPASHHRGNPGVIFNTFPGNWQSAVTEK